jgi:hypothetical protein
MKLWSVPTNCSALNSMAGPGSDACVMADIIVQA